MGTKDRVIELDTLHVNAHSASMVVSGFAGSVGVIFVHTNGVCFMINLTSNQVTKVCRDVNVYRAFLYISHQVLASLSIFDLVQVSIFQSYISVQYE
jgi:hypothetical protein